MAKETALSAIVKGKCPRCRQGNMFTSKSLLPNKFSEMNETCPVCGFRFEIEPGFFIGAMYVSYAISVLVMIAALVILYFFAGDPPLWAYLATVGGILTLLAPVSYRISRVLFLHWFGGTDYQPGAEYLHEKGRL